MANGIPIRTAHSDAVQGLLAEYGTEIPKGAGRFAGGGGYVVQSELPRRTGTSIFDPRDCRIPGVLPVEKR